jgi:hypothetical protein
MSSFTNFFNQLNQLALSEMANNPSQKKARKIQSLIIHVNKTKAILEELTTNEHN